MKRQDIPTIELELEMDIEKEDVTLETSEQIVDKDLPSSTEGEPTMTISPYNISTPKETQGLRRSFQVRFQTKTDYIPIMSGKKCETVNNLLECADILHPDAHMFFCQELIEEVSESAAVIMP